MRYWLTIPRHTARVLAISIGVLLAIHVVLQYVRFTSNVIPWEVDVLFDVDQEQSVPTWFSAAILGIAATLLYAIAGDRRRERDPQHGRWLGLAVIFTLLSLDEIAGFHETLNSVSGITWTLPAAIFVLIFAAWYAPFLWKLPPRMRWQVALAGVVFVSGALLVEFNVLQFLTQNSQQSLAYNLMSGFEEGMEMAGTVLFIHALLGFMRAGEDARLGLATGGGKAVRGTGSTA